MRRSAGPRTDPTPADTVTLEYYLDAINAALRARGGSSHGTTVSELVEALGPHQRPVEMLLTSCAALGLLEGKPYYFGGLCRCSTSGFILVRLTKALRRERHATWRPHYRSFRRKL